MKENHQAVIIGGGLAGLTAAIHLAKSGLTVLVIEKNSYPKHKVCGEYISNEVLPYFDWLGIDLESLGVTQISRLQFSTLSGKTIETTLPMGGFGISRYKLDDFLFRKALLAGCIILQAVVEKVDFENDLFTVCTESGQNFQSKTVIGAFGKRSNLDLKMERLFIQKKSPWLAVKSHYKGTFPEDRVGLHNFRGGYCGVSRIEDGLINICWLADYNTFKKYKNTGDYQRQILAQNPHLKELFGNCEPVFEKPLSIGQISFEEKAVVENHILMVGDSAGLIHPLCGNGMAMAIHSGKIVSEIIIKYYNNEFESRSALEKEYREKWNFHFRKRLKTGKVLAKLLQNQYLSDILMRIIVMLPAILPAIIKKTHGKSITPN